MSIFTQAAGSLEGGTENIYSGSEQSQRSIQTMGWDEAAWGGGSGRAS